MPSPKSRFREGEHYSVAAESGCWLWLGRMDHAGYGMVGDYRTFGERRAARATYTEVHGPIEKGHHVHHKCKTPACVNPDHLQDLNRREHFILHKLTEQTGLTLDDVRDIRQLGRTAGVRAKDVAEQYGIHEITVFHYWGKEPVWADLLGDDPVCKPVLTCVWCGSDFTGRLRNALYCSPGHAKAANNAKKRAA